VRFCEKVVIVTGGASAIGLATARRYASQLKCVKQGFRPKTFTERFIKERCNCSTFLCTDMDTTPATIFVVNIGTVGLFTRGLLCVSS